jgi:hypothetical protein
MHRDAIGTLLQGLVGCSGGGDDGAPAPAAGPQPASVAGVWRVNVDGSGLTLVADTFRFLIGWR